MLELGWFSTGRGEGSRNLLTTVCDAIRRREVRARIQYVFSNREPREAQGSDQFFQLAKSLGLELVCFSSRKFKGQWPGEASQWRAAYDGRVMALLGRFKPDICVLAGYMLIVGPEMCSRYTMINLHPAAPGGPEGTWQEVIWKLIGQRATHSGVKIHLVTEELDRGPTIAYCTYPLTGPTLEAHWRAVEGRTVEELQSREGEELALFKLIRQEGARWELPLLVETLKALALGQLKINRLTSTQPRDLTSVVERAIAAEGSDGCRAR